MAAEITLETVEELQTITAEIAESLEGAMLLLADIASSEEVGHADQTRLHTVKDALLLCCNRADHMADLLDM